MAQETCKASGTEFVKGTNIGTYFFSNGFRADGACLTCGNNGIVSQPTKDGKVRQHKEHRWMVK